MMTSGMMMMRLTCRRRGRCSHPASHPVIIHPILFCFLLVFLYILYCIDFLNKKPFFNAAIFCFFIVFCKKIKNVFIIVIDLTLLNEMAVGMT